MTLICSNLACERNGRMVFKGLSLTAEPGQLIELRGPNGAGKSSLLRQVAGLVPLSQGEILWRGDSDIAQHCHYIGHQDALKSAFSLAENLAFWCGLLGGASIDAALAAFGLENLKDQPTHLLSAGQRRRATLAKLLTAHRPLWLLDEPATALDQQSRSRLCEVVTMHLSAGGVVIMATHDDLGLKPDQTLNLGVA